MDTYYAYVVQSLTRARNQMVAAGVTAFLLGVVMYFTQELWIALPILVTAVWYRMHEEAYNHYKSIKKGMNYDTNKAKEVEQS